MDATAVDKLAAFRWRRLGLVFKPDPAIGWQHSHASLPTCLHLHEAVFRVYFASRDEHQRSHVGWFDIDLDTLRCVRRSTFPAMSPGPIGSFNADGIYISSVLRRQNELWAYTVGWNTAVPAPLFRASIGCAISRDGGITFESCFDGPILDRSIHDPCFVSAPTVVRESTKWIMFYISGLAWVNTEAGLDSRYHLKKAVSTDGITWERSGEVAIGYSEKHELHISRIGVFTYGEQMYGAFGYDCGSGYRIGSARWDGSKWVRDDELASFLPSGEGFDSHAVTYPSLVVHGRKVFMFYNGNRFGADGIGLAVAEI